WKCVARLAVLQVDRSCSAIVLATLVASATSASRGEAPRGGADARRFAGEGAREREADLLVRVGWLSAALREVRPPASITFPRATVRRTRPAGTRRGAARGDTGRRRRARRVPRRWAGAGRALGA